MVSVPSEEDVLRRVFTTFPDVSEDEDELVTAGVSAPSEVCCALSEEAEAAGWLSEAILFWRYAPPKPEAPPTIATARSIATVLPALLSFFLSLPSPGTST